MCFTLNGFLDKLWSQVMSTDQREARGGVGLPNSMKRSARIKNWKVGITDSTIAPPKKASDFLQLPSMAARHEGGFC